MTQPDSKLPLLAALHDAVRTERFGRIVRGYRSVGSTNTIAAQWAARGAPEGSLVYTEFQTNGRGRRGRAWKASAGRNLMFSLIVRPNLDAERLNLVTMAAGVAVCESVSLYAAPRAARLKWPNDVLIEGRKCGGMLLESTLSGRRGPHTLILGIGLNVNEEDFPPLLVPKATSILLETGQRIPRASLLADILYRMEGHYDSLMLDDGATVLALYRGLLEGVGHPVTLYGTDERTAIRGTFVGVNEFGALLVQTTRGTETFFAGDVSTARPN